MLKNGLRRRVLAAFGGVIILAGAGTTGIALAATDFRATLSGDNVPGAATPTAGAASGSRSWTTSPTACAPTSKCVRSAR